MNALRTVSVLLAALTGALAAAAPAAADLPWQSCTAPGYSCASLPVPLDRSGAVPGSVNLSVTRRAAPANPSRTAIVAFAGGPGQAAQPFARDFAKLLAAGLADKDLIVFDQRGTGRSGRLSCKALSRGGDLDRLVGRCADELGARRGAYTTQASVADLEALRVAAGYDHLILYGVSYGTKVALDYAAAYPASTQALILDSVVLPEGADPLRRSSALAVPRVIGTDLCGDNACAAATPDAIADLQQLVGRLAKRDLTGDVFSASGKRFTARLGPSGLLDLLTAGDLNPALRAELPAAVRSALRGDRQPLLRISANAAGLDNGAALQAPADDVGDGSLYLATVCEESTFPWTRGAPTAQRTKEFGTNVAALPPGTFGLFPSAIGLLGFGGTCLGWKVASTPPAAPGPLPDVPVLVLSGASDLRTPLEDAQALAARFRQATTVAVADTGHSVLTGESGKCGKDAVSSFLGGKPINTACAAVPNPFAPTAGVPRRLADVPRARGVAGAAGRTLNVIPATITDARRQILGAILATGEVPESLGGLRGGSVRVLSESRWQLRSYELVPGVRLSGTYRVKGTSTFTVSGSAAARGTVRLTSSGRATGRLGGTAVRVKARAAATRAALPGELPSFAEALRAARERPGVRR